MLMVNRKVGEVIRIGDDITITVANIRRGEVRLGVTAPKDVIVDRLEVRRAKEAQKHGEGQRDGQGG